MLITDFDEIFFKKIFDPCLFFIYIDRDSLHTLMKLVFFFFFFFNEFNGVHHFAKKPFAQTIYF